MATAQRHMEPMRLAETVAVCIDGSFFLKRYFSLTGYDYGRPPERVADDIHRLALAHVGPDKLYRIYFYDCPPYDKKQHNPISKRCINFAKTEVAVFRLALYGALKRKRKVALRFGQVRDGSGWVISPRKAKELIAGKIQVGDLQPEDITFELRQKGVDMKMGIDISSLAYKRLVTRIVLVAGDSDFVPAAKLARIEGIDVVLDPMRNPVNPDLMTHVDGVNTRVQYLIPKSLGGRANESVADDDGDDT